MAKDEDKALAVELEENEVVEGKDEYPPVEVSDEARDDDVTPPVQDVADDSDPADKFPEGDANAPHENTERPDGQRQKATDARGLGRRNDNEDE